MKMKKAWQYVAMACAAPVAIGLSIPSIVGAVSLSEASGASAYVVAHVTSLYRSLDPFCDIGNAFSITGQADVTCPLLPANNVAGAL